MLPDRCTVSEQQKRCVNPPEFIISIVMESDEYMIGVTCRRHRGAVAKKIMSLQDAGDIPAGQIRFELIKAVGTDCIKGHADDIIQID